MGGSLVGHIPNKENVADLMTKVLYGQKINIWSVIFFMIFMMTISCPEQKQSGKLDPIGNSIKLVGTTKMHPQSKPGY